MIKFNIPGLYFKKEITIKFLNYCRNNPQEVREDVSIGAVYDSIPYCIWNGGRIFSNYYQATKKEILDLKDIFNHDFNIPIRLIYTNAQVEEKHLSDRFCNLVLELLDGENNEVVVASDLLEEYIRKTYPQYKIISSTTKCLSNPNTSLGEISKDYFQICLDYNLNHNFDFLESISDKDKVEFLVNAICPPGCPNRKLHYELNGKAALNYQNCYNIECTIQRGIGTLNSYKNSIQPEEIFGKYKEMGFTNFKLEGRTLPDSEVAANYVKYMIKPEFQLKCLSQILRRD